MTEHPEGQPPAISNVYDLEASDPHSRLINRENHSPGEIAQIGQLMAALAALRAAEQRISEASQRYMALGQTDMKALHFLVVARNTDTITTREPSLSTWRFRLPPPRSCWTVWKPADISFVHPIQVTDEHWPSPLPTSRMRQPSRRSGGNTPSGFMQRHG